MEKTIWRIKQVRRGVSIQRKGVVGTLVFSPRDFKIKSKSGKWTQYEKQLAKALVKAWVDNGYKF